MPEKCNSREKLRIYNASTGKIEEVNKVCKTEQEWKRILTPEQFAVTRLKGTENPYSRQCPIPTQGKSGIYQCVCCGTDLFKYENKFESGTGWPSFWEPLSWLNISLVEDSSFGLHRTEVLCHRCDAHLGHVFDDGPPPTGKRYCINTVSLKLFEPETKVKTEKAILAAGCFWGVEAAFRQVKGVISVTSGYTGGDFKNPTYEDVSSGKTAHAEAVQIEFDPGKVSYQQLLDVFWRIHDPTTLNRQGPDTGNQYRSAIFYRDSRQEELARQSRDKLEQSRKFKNKIVTQILPAKEFYPAEEYHQRYFEKKGIKPTCHI